MLSFSPRWPNAQYFVGLVIFFCTSRLTVHIIHSDLERMFLTTNLEAANMNREAQLNCFGIGECIISQGVSVGKCVVTPNELFWSYPCEKEK